MRCVLHGSYRSDLDAIDQIADQFRAAGWQVLAPEASPVESIKDGLVRFKDNRGKTNQQIELEFLEAMKSLNPEGFSYFVNPSGRLGPSASYELSFAHSIGLPVYFLCPLRALPALVPAQTVISPEAIIDYVVAHNQLPPNPLLPQRDELSLFRRVFNL